MYRDEKAALTSLRKEILDIKDVKCTVTVATPLSALPDFMMLGA